MPSSALHLPSALDMTGQPEGPQALSESTCLALLRSVEVGRVAVLHNGQPMIFPINFVVDHGCVVFRTAHLATLDRACLAGSVAFEADGVTSSDQGGDDTAWSVIITGTASTIASVPELLETATLPLHCWHHSSVTKQRFIRITPMAISGRRFHIDRPSSLAVVAVRSAPE